VVVAAAAAVEHNACTVCAMDATTEGAVNDVNYDKPVKGQMMPFDR